MAFGIKRGKKISFWLEDLKEKIKLYRYWETIYDAQVLAPEPER